MNKKGQPNGSRTFSCSQYRSGWGSDGEIRTAATPGKVRLRWARLPRTATPLRSTQQSRNAIAATNYLRTGA